MIIKTVKKTPQYLVVDREFIDDSKLSLDAKGFMIQVLANPDPERILELAGTHITACAELIDRGYLETALNPG